MGDQMGPDLLSDLPSSIIETILTLLPIRDANMMSFLSTKWRYKWASISQLSFTDECVDLLDKTKHKASLTKFITHALLLHKGPLTTFKICSSILKKCAEVDQWILFLSRKNVTELVLELNEREWFKVPSCLFSCERLIHLELRGCNLELPPSFKGFSCLTTLILHPVLMESQDLESLISSCPLLEDLTLVYDSDLVLHIYAPNLNYLFVAGELYGLHIENSPLLKEMCIAFGADYSGIDAQEDFQESSVCNFFKVLGSVRDLEKLVGRVYFTPYLSIGLDLWKPHVTFDHLKVIELDQVSFEDMKEMMVILKLITNSPFLQELYISGSPIDTNDVDLPGHQPEFMEIEYPSRTFKLLKIVKMTDICGMPLEMELIKYLLENSPSLEKMSITPCINLNDTRFNMLLKLVKFRRASSLVEVLFVQD